MSNQKIIVGDALARLKEMDAQSVDLIIADPPYNLGKNYGNNTDHLEFEDYLTFSKDWLHEADRVLKPSGTIYVFMGVQFISYIYDILSRDMGYNFNAWVCWNYTQGMGKKKGFSPRHDDILMFNKSSEFTFNLDDIRVPQKYYRERNNMRGANPGDVWSFSHVHYCNENRQNHPTQKPEGLIERMVLASSHKGDVVLDPFSGSGTTLRVCQQLGRHGIGIEINPDYVLMTQERLDKPFYGFDSVDPRMNRVPLDMAKMDVRLEYLRCHQEWFLKNHENTAEIFSAVIEKTYGAETAEAVLGPSYKKRTKSATSYALAFIDDLEAE